MRVYFTADKSAEEKAQRNFSKIIEVLTNSGVLVMSNLLNQNVSGFSSQDLEKIEESGEVLLEKMDALMIEGSKPFAESGYMIAIALAHKKPILYLTEKSKPVSQNLIHLKKDKETAKLLDIEQYTDSSLDKVVLSFLQKVEKGQGREVPNIKFTLRITPRIERYLHWKTHNTKVSKADFLRELIEKLIDEDESYLKYSHKHDDK